MSKANHIVGSALSKCINMNGGSMHTEQAPSSATSTISILRSNFALLSYGYSYRTLVAKIVENESTGQHELWVSPRYYSPTTQRHKTHYINGFRAWCEANNQPFESNLYYTSVADDLIGFYTRVEPSLADYAIRQAEEKIVEADKPRLRDGTRRGALTSGIYILTQSLDLMTRNVPQTVLDSTPRAMEYVTRSRDLVDFMTHTHDIADIGEMRAACRAYTTLSSN